MTAVATCRAPGCSGRTRSRGYCNAHYLRVLRHGDLTDRRRDGAPAGIRRVYGQRRIKLPGHPLATARSAWIDEARVLLFGELGPGPHPCVYCGELLEWGDRLVAAHLNCALLDDRLENLAPACRSCIGRRPAPRVCRVCARPLDGLRSDARTCSATCRGRAARGASAPSPTRCKGCGEPIPTGRSDARWCSQRCRSRFRRRSRAKAGRQSAETPSRPSSAEADPRGTAHTTERTR